MPRLTAVQRLVDRGVNIQPDDAEMTLEEFMDCIVLAVLLRARADIVQIALAVRRAGGPNASDVQNMNEIVSRGVLPRGDGN